MRPRPGLILGWMIMAVAVASDGLTLLNGSSFIHRSVRVQAQDLLTSEQWLVRDMIAQGDGTRDGTADAAGLRRQVAGLAVGFAGRIGYLPAAAGGRIATGSFSDLLPPALARQVRAAGQPLFQERWVAGKRWFALYTPIDVAASGGTTGPPRTGVLLLAIPAAPLESQAATERDGLIGTALLTLILLGYALVGVSQWLGIQFEGREARLATAKAELELALGHMSDGLCVFDRNDCVTVFNRQLCDILGLPPDAVWRGAHYSTLLASSIATGNHRGRDVGEVMAERRALIASGRPVKVQQEAQDGRIVEAVFCPAADGGWLVTCADITERLRIQEQIAHMAEHDPLTGLPNRAAFSARLATEVAQATAVRPLALLWLDLDRFKHLNDTRGHPAGDQLLRIVADRLRRSLRQTDGAAYRLGGDEFAVVLAGLGPPEATRIARRVLRVLNQSCEIAGQPYRVHASIGLALAPADATDPDRLMSRADLALYAAKASGRNAVRCFGPEIEDRATGRATMERALQGALTEGQFALWYQPILALPSRELVGFEALLRWNHPDRGLIAPGAFIQVAEETQLIEEIGAWALAEACAEAAGWPAAVGVAVNLSTQQLRRPGLAAQVERALRDADLDAARLELEVTETAIIQDPDAAFALLAAIQARGVRIALDDFGTGYSSLSFLTRFKFDTIKIDRSFICDMASRSECAAIVDAVSSLGTHLGLVTTAEGIETAEQLRRVGELGCRRAQGFLLGRPLPAAEARALAWSRLPVEAPADAAVAACDGG
ncbi:MAG: EAL domain-containing protein [Proteobacteria bacterium]|nr:EAL domain-containing protein [Pseudomonadota bacterium]